MRPIAIVTGGSRGIGASTAILLAEHGFDVAITYLAELEAADSVVASCRERGAESIAVRCDVAVEGDIVGLFEQVDEELGAVAALVNNAGIVAEQSRVEAMSALRITRIMAVNVVGTIIASREAIRRMSTRAGGDGGAIVNVSSAASRLGSAGEYVDYAASKGAVDSFTVGVAREVAEDRIRVNAVRPGLIRTEVHARAGRPDRIEQLRSTIPLGRGGEPEEVANLIAWLCSPAASYVTGALIDVSGGR